MPAAVPGIIAVMHRDIRAMRFMTLFITAIQASGYIMAIACVHINCAIAHSGE
jgi:hypothetical protein